MTTSCCWTAQASGIKAANTAANKVPRPQPSCLAALGAMPNHCATPLEIAADCAASFAVCPRCLKNYDWTAECAKRWSFVSACTVRLSFEQARCCCVHKLRRNVRFALSTCEASAIIGIASMYAEGKAWKSDDLRSQGPYGGCLGSPYCDILLSMSSAMDTTTLCAARFCPLQFLRLEQTREQLSAHVSRISSATAVLPAHHMTGLQRAPRPLLGRLDTYFLNHQSNSQKHCAGCVMCLHSELLVAISQSSR